MKIEIANGREWFYQWDKDQELVISDDGMCNEVHFANQGAAEALICEIGSKDGVRKVKLPNILLQKDVPIMVYLYSKSADGAQTFKVTSFQVRHRPKPADYVYTETEVWSYKALEDRIQNLERMDVDREAVAESVRLYMAEHPITTESIGAVSVEELPLIVNDVLAQAKASGAFKGDTGEQGLQGPRGEKGDTGAAGKTPVKGEDYYTEADKTEMVNAIIAALPVYTGEVVDV